LKSRSWRKRKGKGVKTKDGVIDAIDKLEAAKNMDHGTVVIGHRAIVTPPGEEPESEPEPVTEPKPEPDIEIFSLRMETLLEALMVESRINSIALEMLLQPTQLLLLNGEAKKIRNNALRDSHI